MSIYNVGPGYAPSLHDVPWATLQPGDIVRIHWQEQPYRQKVCLSRSGTAQAPIIISGVLGPDGQRPVLSSQDATVDPALPYGNQDRCCLKIGSGRFEGAFTYDQPGKPSYIVVENLELCDAHPQNTFFNAEGQPTEHVKCASGIYIEMGDNIIVRNCRLHHNANGFFCAKQSSNITVSGNTIEYNGIAGSMYEHNNYTSAHGILFEYNYFGPTLDGALGSNLKDRSAGTVIRYNMIIGANRALDLVEEGDFVDLPEYRQTFVYGNLMADIGQGTNPAILHYGGDSGRTELYRKGTLYFYHNTVVHLRPGAQHIFQIETNDERVEAYNNIFYMAADDTSLCSRNSGTLYARNNWITAGYRPVQSAEDTLPGYLHDAAGMLPGAEPGFYALEDDAFSLTASSPCIGRALPLPELLQQRHPVLWQYDGPNSAVRRLSAHDLGALEL